MSTSTKPKTVAVSLFDTVNQSCKFHGVTQHAKLTTDPRAQHTCLQCASYVLTYTCSPDTHTESTKR